MKHNIEEVDSVKPQRVERVIFNLEIQRTQYIEHIEKDENHEQTRKGRIGRGSLLYYSSRYNDKSGRLLKIPSFYEL